jgi:hypothetical protein
MPSPCRRLCAAGGITNRPQTAPGLFDHNSVLAETQPRAIGAASRLLKTGTTYRASQTEGRQGGENLPGPLVAAPNRPDHSVGFWKSSGSFATLAAIRRALSLVSILAANHRPGVLSISDLTGHRADFRKVPKSESSKCVYCPILYTGPL